METKYNEKDYCKLGQRCLNFGFYKSATDCYKKALEINPNYSDAKSGLIKILEIENCGSK